MNIFGLKINFQDLLAQVGHAFTVIMGLFTGIGLFDPTQAASLVSGVNAVAQAGGALASGSLTAFHAMGWSGLLIGLVNWVLHNTDVIQSLLPKSPANQVAVK